MTPARLIAFGLAILIGCANVEPASEEADEAVPLFDLDSALRRHGPVLQPFVTCVSADETTLPRARFGYANDTGRVLSIPVGRFNALFPGARERGQPTRFEPGRVENAFEVELSRALRPVSWRLGTKSAVASRHSPRCLAPPACPAGETECSGRCVALDSDSLNCGNCGVVCEQPTPGCRAGLCSCPEPRTTCGMRCLDTDSNDQNCGACGVRCEMNQRCQDGACRCPPELTVCGSACVDVQHDPQNCGACGNACAAGDVCSSGLCRCFENFVRCNGLCVDLSEDPANCGACGNVCPRPGACDASNCVCASGGPACAGTCPNKETDAHNCGRCGNVCPPGQACANGMCG